MLKEKISAISGFSTSRLEYLAKTASVRYKHYQIKKRQGGYRDINHPSRELKFIQRLINELAIKEFPVHSSATAYSIGSSIKKNADLHLGTCFTIRIDFKNFFPSFVSGKLKEFFIERQSKYNKYYSFNDIGFLINICCRYDALTIGAPSSPHLTNIVMFDFDNKIFEWCRERNLIYSRYADDIFVSAYEPDMLGNALVKLRELSSSFRYANLSINEDKTTFLSRRYKRAVCGLV